MCTEADPHNTPDAERFHSPLLSVALYDVELLIYCVLGLLFSYKYISKGPFCTVETNCEDGIFLF